MLSLVWRTCQAWQGLRSDLYYCKTLNPSDSCSAHVYATIWSFLDCSVHMNSDRKICEFLVVVMTSLGICSLTVKPENWDRKTTSTIFELNLKQTLVKYWLDDGLWPGPFQGSREWQLKSYFSEAYKDKPKRPPYFPSGSIRCKHISWCTSCLRDLPPMSNQEQVYIVTYFLPVNLPPTCDPAHLV